MKSFLESLAAPAATVETFVRWHKEAWQPLEYLVYLVYRELLKPGGTAVDGGAHAGMHTEGMARAVYPDGWVHAIEPSRDTLLRFKANVGEVNWDHIVLHEVALSDTDGEAEFISYPSNPAVSGLRVAPMFGDKEPPSEKYMVPIRRLDGLLADAARKDARLLRSVDLMKFDLEGWELNALRGFEQQFVTQRPYLIFEFSGETDPLQREILSWLWQRNFIVFDNFFRLVDENYLTERTDIVGKMSLNFVAVHPTRLHAVEAAAHRIRMELERTSLDFIKQATERHFRLGYC